MVSSAAAAILCFALAAAIREVSATTNPPPATSATTETATTRSGLPSVPHRLTAAGPEKQQQSDPLLFLPRRQRLRDATREPTNLGGPASLDPESRLLPAPLESSRHLGTAEDARRRNNNSNSDTDDTAVVEAHTTIRGTVSPPSRQQRRRKQGRSTSERSKPTTTTTTTTTMRRIQREWKDAMDAGIAFDWVQGQPLRSSSKQQQAQEVWLGPLSLQQWRVWHFSFVGLGSTTTPSTSPSPNSSTSHSTSSSDAYAGGVYHGRIFLPRNYPASPPRIQLLTPNGRFHTHTDICLTTVSNFHPESWQPAVSNVRTIVEALRWHMRTSMANEIGGMIASLAKRQELAKQSRRFTTVLPTSNSNIHSGRKNTAAIVVVDHHRMLQNGWIAPEPSSGASVLSTNANPTTIQMSHENGILERVTTDEPSRSKHDKTDELSNAKRSKPKCRRSSRRRRNPTDPRLQRRLLEIQQQEQPWSNCVAPASDGILSVLLQHSPMRLLLLCFCVLFAALNW